MSQTDPQFVYRQVGIDRIDDIRLLWEELNVYHVQFAPLFADEMGSRTFAGRRSEIEAKAASGKVRIELVAAGSDGPDIAYCVASVSADGVAEIDSLFIQSQFRGHGIGSELMHRALAWFRAAGATSTIISVTHGNDKAIAFYRRFGFYPRAVVLRQRDEGAG
jgi:diamine N-acetyltransferase